jgi:hypothetical protein
MFPVFEQVAEMNRAYVANMLKSVDAAVEFGTKASAFGVKAANDFAAATAADMHAIASVKAPQGLLQRRAPRSTWLPLRKRKLSTLQSNKLRMLQKRS